MRPSRPWPPPRVDSNLSAEDFQVIDPYPPADLRGLWLSVIPFAVALVGLLWWLS